VTLPSVSKEERSRTRDGPRQRRRDARTSAADVDAATTTTIVRPHHPPPPPSTRRARAVARRARLSPARRGDLRGRARSVQRRGCVPVVARRGRARRRAVAPSVRLPLCAARWCRSRGLATLGVTSGLTRAHSLAVAATTRSRRAAAAITAATAVAVLDAAAVATRALPFWGVGRGVAARWAPVVVVAGGWAAPKASAIGAGPP